MKKKLPAYGKQLLEARRAGTHPAVIVVVFGEDWRVPGVWARLAVKAAEWSPESIDWNVTRGVSVLILDRSSNADDPYDDTGARKLFFMAAEIARFAGFVTLEVPEPLFLGEEAGPSRVHVHEWAFCCRTWVPGQRRWTWPAWWSEEIEKINAANRQRWFAEAEAELERIAGRVAA